MAVKSVSIKKTTLFLFILKVVKFFIAFVSLSITAKFFGVSPERDMWVLASVMISTVVISVWGPLNEVFRTKFVFIREQEGDEQARDKTASLVGLVLWVSVVLGVLFFIFAKPISSIIATDASDDSLRILTKLVILLIPTLLITELSNISTSILNAYNIFYIPEIVGCFTAILNIFLIIILAPGMGIYALLVSSYVSAFALFIVLIYFLHANGINIWYKLFRFSLKEAWLFIAFSLPYFFPYFISQLNVFSQNFLAGMLGEGSISIIDYSNKFAINVQTIFSGIMTTVMVPMLAKAYINNLGKDFNRVLIENMQTCFLILGVCLALLVGAAEPVCSFFFASGRVSQSALLEIITLTRIYGIALIGVLIYMFSSFVLLSSDQRKYNAFIGVILQVLIFACYVAGFKVFGSLAIFPVVFGLGHFVAAFFMFSKSKVVEHKMVVVFLVRSITSLFIYIACIYGALLIIPVERPIWGIAVAGIAIVLACPILFLGNGLSFKSAITKISGLKNRH